MQFQHLQKRHIAKFGMKLEFETEAEYQIKHVEIKSRQVYRFYC